MCFFMYSHMSYVSFISHILLAPFRTTTYNHRQKYHHRMFKRLLFSCSSQNTHTHKTQQGFVMRNCKCYLLFYLHLWTAWIHLGPWWFQRFLFLYMTLCNYLGKRSIDLTCPYCSMLDILGQHQSYIILGWTHGSDRNDR